MPDGSNPRLETWKEVATFFSRDERTVKRWEAQRGLPIRRLPGSGRSRIYALVGELETWRDGGGVEDDVAASLPADPVPDPTGSVDRPDKDGAVARRAPRRWVRAGWIAVAGALLLSLGWFGLAHWHTRSGSTSPSFAAQRAYVAATLDWQKRTPDGLERAEREYRAAIASDPGYAAAYVGLANTYNVLREYTAMPDSQAYPLAKASAVQAIALDEQSSGAHAALAFAEYWGFWNIPKARAEFARAVELDPRNATAHIWYATFLSNLGEEGAALREIDAARALDPKATDRNALGIATDRALIVALGGHGKAGIAALRVLSAEHPSAPGPLIFIAELSLKTGDYLGYLDANRRLVTIVGDAAKVAAQARVEEAYRRSGGRALLVRLIADGEAAYVGNRESAFELAVLHSLAGDQDRALALLRTSADRRESTFLQITNPANFRVLRAAPAFQAVLARLKALDG